MHLAGDAEPTKVEPSRAESLAALDVSTWTVSSLDQVKGLPGFSGRTSYRETLADDLAGLHVSDDQISSILAQYDHRAATGDAEALSRFDQEVAGAMRRLTELQQDAARRSADDAPPRLRFDFDQVPQMDRALVLAPERLAAQLRDLEVPERDVPGLVEDYASMVGSGDQAAWDAFTDRLESYALALSVRSGSPYLQAFVRDMHDARVPIDQIVARVREYEALQPGDEEGLASFDRDLASDLRSSLSDTARTSDAARQSGPTLSADLRNSLVLQPERLVGRLRAYGVDEADMGGFVSDYADALHGGDPAAIARFATRLDDYLRTRPGLAQPLRIGPEDPEALPDYLNGLIRDLRGLNLPEDAIATRVAQYQRLARRGDPDELAAFDRNMADLMRNLQNELDRGLDALTDSTGDSSEGLVTEPVDVDEVLGFLPRRPGGVRRPASDGPGGVDAARSVRRPRPPANFQPQEENHTLVLEREPEPAQGLGGGHGFLSELLAEDEEFPLEQSYVETPAESETDMATLTQVLTIEPESAAEIVDALIHELERQRSQHDEELEHREPEQEQESEAEQEPEQEPELPEFVPPPLTADERAWQQLTTDLRATHPGPAPARASMSLAEYTELLDQRTQTALADATDSYAESPVNAMIGFDFYVAQRIAQALDDARDEALTALGIDPEQVSMDALRPLASLPRQDDGSSSSTQEMDTDTGTDTDAVTETNLAGEGQGQGARRSVAA